MESGTVNASVTLDSEYLAGLWYTLSLWCFAGVTASMLASWLVGRVSISLVDTYALRLDREAKHLWNVRGGEGLVALAVFSTAMYYVWFNYSDAFVENPFTAWSVESDAVLAFALGFYLYRLLSRISSPAYHLPQLSTVVYHLVMVVTILYCLIAREMAVFAGAFLSQEIVTANMAASSLMKSSKYTLQKWYFRNQVMLLWLWGIVRLVIDARVLIMLLSYRIEMWASLSAIMVALLCSRVAFQVYYDLLAMWGAWLATMHELEKVTAIRKSNAELY